MANNINWGKIYESTAWGSGVIDNSIDWGKIYAEDAGGGFTGLLDTYTGAVAAYSLRLLSTTYTGDAIVVRRSSDNTTQAIGFVNNELDTTSLESFCSGTDGFITTWYDQSGNGNDVVQATASKQPKIVSTGTSLGYIENDSSPTNLVSSSLSWTSGTDYSVFGVVQNYGTGCFIAANTGQYAALAQSGSTSQGGSGFTEGNRYQNGTLIGPTRGDMYTATTSFTELSMYVSATTTNLLAVGFYISSYNSTRFKEYVVYPNQTVSRTGVENNIITHYGF